MTTAKFTVGQTVTHDVSDVAYWRAKGVRTRTGVVDEVCPDGLTGVAVAFSDGLPHENGVEWFDSMEIQNLCVKGGK